MSERQSRMYGYARTLVGDQDLSGTMAALEAFGVEHDSVIVDRCARRGPSHAEFDKLLRRLREGDVLVVKSLDALGDNVRDIAENWESVTDTRKADVVVLDVPLLDTRTTPYNMAGKLVEDLVPQLLSAVMRVEQETRRRAQAKGIAQAQAKGVHTGRPALRRPREYESVQADFLAHRINRSEASQLLGVSLTTFDKWRRQDTAGNRTYEKTEQEAPAQGGED